MTTVERVTQRLTGRTFFYGWIIVALTFITSMTTAGIMGYGFAFFVVPMSEALGVSRGAFSSVMLFRLVLMPLVPFLGALVDRKHGPRLMIAGASVGAGLTLMLTSQVQALWHVFVVYGVLFGLATMLMGGQVVEPAVIAKWFIRKRGQAMAIGTMGISAGGFVIAPVVGWMVGSFGWRTSWMLLGLLVIVLIAPLAMAFMRRAPEDMGLLPDGDTPREALTEGAVGAVEQSLTLKQALRTRVMWLLLLIQTLGFFALFPVIIHQVAYVQDKGFTLGTATAVATVVAFFAMVGKLPWGYLADRYPLKLVVSLCLLPAGLSLLPLVWGQGAPAMYAYAVLHGVTMGGFPTLMNVAWASYFGRQHMGAIRGVVTPVSQVVAAASPVFAGWLWDMQGTYDVPFIIFAATWVVGGFLMLLMPPPHKSYHRLVSLRRAP